MKRDGWQSVVNQHGIHCRVHLMPENRYKAYEEGWAWEELGSAAWHLGQARRRIRMVLREPADKREPGDWERADRLVEKALKDLDDLRDNSLPKPKDW